MSIQPELLSRLKSAFEPLRKTAGGSLPQMGFLAEKLNAAIQDSTGPVEVSSDVVRAFGTAGVEAWLRAVHSFLVSCAVTESSPIWASVTGYYASHYAIRALAHTLGYFLLFRLKKVVRLRYVDGAYQCIIEPKSAQDREHVYYWRVVKDERQFAGDSLFRRNVFNGDISDSGHRERANYADHVAGFPTFNVAQVSYVKDRIWRISQILFNDPPIPRLGRFPDVESVQIVAYHRIVRFRQLLDEALTTKNRFWAVHRQPSWAGDFINFQLTEQVGLRGLTS